MKIKKMMSAIIVVAVISALGIVAFAASALTPAEIASSLTGRTVEQVTAQRGAGKSYGTIASEAGKFDEFKIQMLEQKKAILDQRVKGGRLTQQQADTIYNNIKNNQANCTGSGNQQIGKNNGVGFGQDTRQGMCNGNCDGSGMGNAGRNGNRNGNGLGFGRG